MDEDFWGMSIILKALKRHKEIGAEPIEPRSGENNILSDEEGFFRGKESFVRKSGMTLELFNKEFLKANKVYLLSGVFIFVIAFSTTMYFITGKEIEKVPPPPELTAPDVKVETSAAAQADETQETTDNAALINRAYAAYEKGDYNESIRLLRVAIANDQENAALRNSLGLAYMKKKLYSSAADEYKKATELNEECAECFNNFGYLKSVLGESVEAKEYLERAIALSPDYAEPHFNLGVLYEKEGDIGHAIEFYTKFIRLYPDKTNDIVSKVTKRISELSGQ